jgi:hypothetical protein
MPVAIFEFSLQKIVGPFASSGLEYWSDGGVE